MPHVSLVFGDVPSGDEVSYIRQRVRLLHYVSQPRSDVPARLLPPDAVDNYADEIAASLKPSSPPPLAAPVDLSSLAGATGKVMRRRHACMLDEVGRLFPLIDGEHVEEDAASYLERDWAGFPAGAVALRQRTNLAVLYYIYPDIRADPGTGQLVEHSLMRSDRVLLGAAAAYEPDWGAAAKTLAQALAGVAPPPFNLLGAMLISAFWKSSDSAAAQWQQVYANLQQIVKNALAANNVQQAAQKLQGFVSFLDTEYAPLKASPSSSKQDLMAALAPYDTAFFLDIVSSFRIPSISGSNPSDMDEGLAAASLANFMTGACLHLALNQERALVDPKVSTPSLSPYATTVSNLAGSYATYAKQAAPLVKSLRLAQISAVQQDSQTSCRGGAAGGCTMRTSYWFTDSNSGYRSQDYTYNSQVKNGPDAEGDAAKARTAYVGRISSQMDTMLQGQVFDVVAAWQKLAANPVPLPSP